MADQGVDAVVHDAATPVELAPDMITAHGAVGRQRPLLLPPGVERHDPLRHVLEHDRLGVEGEMGASTDKADASVTRGRACFAATSQPGFSAGRKSIPTGSPCRQ